MPHNRNPFRLGQLCFVDEKTAGIRYHNVSEKQARPFIIYKVTKEFVILLPLTSDKYNNADTIWPEVEFYKKPAKIMITLPTIIRKGKVFKLMKLEIGKDKFAFTPKYNVVIANEKMIAGIKHHYNIWLK